ncbi:hypothetical protein ACE6H2_001208 [Prunus campanulata]
MTVPREKGGSQPEYGKWPFAFEMESTKAIDCVVQVETSLLSACFVGLGPKSGYEGMYEEDEEDDIVVDKEEEGDEGTIPVRTNVAEDRHEGTAHEGTKVA